MSVEITNWREEVSVNPRIAILEAHDFAIPQEKIAQLINERRISIKELILDEIDDPAGLAKLSPKDILLLLDSYHYFTILQEPDFEIDDNLIRTLQTEAGASGFTAEQMHRLSEILKGPLPTNVVLKNFELNLQDTLVAIEASEYDIVEPGAFNPYRHRALFQRILATSPMVLLKSKCFVLDADTTWKIINKLELDSYTSGSRSRYMQRPFLIAASTGIIPPGIELGLRHGHFSKMLKRPDEFEYPVITGSRLERNNLLENDNFLFLVLLYCSEDEIPENILASARNMLERRLSQEGPYMKIFLEKAFMAYERLRKTNNDDAKDYDTDEFGLITADGAMKAFLSIKPEEIEQFKIHMKKLRREELRWQKSIRF